MSNDQSKESPDLFTPESLIGECLSSIEPYGLNGTSCLAIGVWLWSRKGIDISSMRGAKARAYLDRLELFDFSKPQQRKTQPLLTRRYKQSEIDQAAQYIANFAIRMSRDEAIEFLVKLTVQWVQTMNADSILASAIANKKAISSHVTDNELSNILLERIFYELVDLEAIDTG